MKKQLFSIVLLAFMGLVACNKKSDVVENDNIVTNRPLIQKADEIQDGVVQGRLLQSSSRRDKDGFIESIRQARLALVLLAKDPNSKLGVQIGYQSLKSMEKLELLRADMSVLATFYKELSEVILSAAKRTGVELDVIGLSQFTYNFSDDLAPFMQQTTGALWGTGSSLDESYIRIRGTGRKNEAWLISPSFDLRGLSKPAFRITHNLTADRNDRFPLDPFNRVIINKTLFKVMVSTKYKEGDKLIMSEWKDVSNQLGTWPSGVDFHTVESSLVDLTPFVSENTTIAFVFNEDTPVVKRHYFSWQINRFQLTGIGELPTVNARQAVLNSTTVGVNELNPYAEVRMLEQGSGWNYFGINENVKFAKIQAKGAVSDTWLMSPKFKIKNVDGVALKLNEVVLNPRFEAMEIFISTEYSGGDPRLSSWVKLDRTNKKVDDIAKWTILSQGPYNLSAYIGKDVVVGLRYTSQPEDKHGWELENITLIGSGDAITTERYTFTFPVKDPNAVALPNFNFSKGNEGFKSIVSVGTPATFEMKSFSGSQYVNITGFKAKNAGTSRFVSPEFELKASAGKKVAFRLTQNFNFYSPDDQKKVELLKLFLKRGDLEEQIKLQKIPTGTNFDQVTSEDYIIPESWIGGNIQLVFEYTSGNGIFPQWSLYQALFVNPEN